ncbi:nitrate- and nitrite sensing domain-containing protein [Streptomyces sp. A012304]|uniref:sensor histidine kinase n=1 Tax=Streptomyces sp. A012304 TaxID=375446 RepID=UPI0022326273|nr:nitrate- and nitrite sensing domain-containing protein [Streptomyces sp. A012304]GKQ37417.1 histidine kinase [Streptomyces sp. A012304]
MSPRTGGRRRRLGSIRLSLILLALVPGVTLTAMWGVTTIQMFSEGLRLREQTELSRSTGAMGTEATLALQQERSLSAVWLADPRGSRAPLEAQRKVTDAAVARLVSRADDIQQAPARVRDRLYSVVASVGSLEYYRGQVDDPVHITAAQALDQYTSIIDDQIHAFHELSQVDDGDLTSQAGPLVGLEHTAELVSEEDLHLTLAGPEGRMDQKEWAEFAQTVNTRRWLVQDQVLPSLTGDARTQTEEILNSREWHALEAVEDKVLAARANQRENGDIPLPDVQKEWRAALIEVSDQYSVLIREQTAGLLQRSADEARDLLVKAGALSAGGLVALLLCVGMSWRITRSLSRRLRGLRMATLSLAHERLPDVVARLDRGETVDVDSATPPLDYGGDELGQVAQAFNTAQRTAVHTAVELADTRRGFQKVILGIARQSQNLVNLQLSKLDALERRHQDPEVLKGLYELDSAASQLRRYEENLVIISGGRPGRRWSEPVSLIDILRSAVGEVAEYQRVEVHADEEVAIAPPAVADVIHLLAELIDNATSYSPAPNPVGVRAAMVAKGLAIEVEDRGLGMSEEDYASFNAQLAVEPKFDVVALADDLRLGMFVIARLATRHGIAVTLRSSPYGGTTAIVLVPHDVVVRETSDAALAALPAVPQEGPPDDTAVPPQPSSAAEGGGTSGAEADGTSLAEAGGPSLAKARGMSLAAPEHSRPDEARHAGVGDDTCGAGPGAPAGAGVRARGATAATATAAPARPDGLAPLPRRIPQTSLADELREEPAPTEEDGFPDDFTAERAASSLAGFQRGTLRARDDDADEPPSAPEETAAAPAPGPRVTAAGSAQTPTPPADRS